MYIKTKIIKATPVNILKNVGKHDALIVYVIDLFAFESSVIENLSSYLLDKPLLILANKREKQLLELLNEIPESETMFFEDHLMSVSTNNAELKLEYVKIKKVKQSKNLYLPFRKVLLLSQRKTYKPKR